MKWRTVAETTKLTLGRESNRYNTEDRSDATFKAEDMAETERCNEARHNWEGLRKQWDKRMQQKLGRKRNENENLCSFDADREPELAAYVYV